MMCPKTLGVEYSYIELKKKLFPLARVNNKSTNSAEKEKRTHM